MHGTTAPETRYYRPGPRYYHRALQYYRPRNSIQNNPDATKQRAVELLAWYYRSPLWYYRKAGAVQRWEGTDIKNYIRGYFRRVGVDAKTRRGSTVSQQRYYRARRGCKKLHPPLTAAYLRN